MAGVNEIQPTPAGAGPASSPDHIAYLLHSATRRARAAAEAAAPAFLGPPLRASESRLLDIVPTGGGRVTELAAQLGVSKQALGQLVKRLTDLGYVATSPDPEDRRARRVRRTPSGERYRHEARKLLTAVEDGWRAQVGVQPYETFRAVLQEIAHGTPADGADADPRTR